MLVERLDALEEPTAPDSKASGSCQKEMVGGRANESKFRTNGT